MPEEKVYIGTKIVSAYRMTKHEFRNLKGNENDGSPDQDGYKVRYEDGYESWSPIGAFELAYREITPREKELIG